MLEVSLVNLRYLIWMALKAKSCFFLANTDKEVIIQKDIEESLDISKASASALIKRMVKNKFIGIENSSEDKRIKMINITPSGLEKIEQLRKFFHYFNEGIVSELDDEEMATLLAIIEKMIVGMHKKLSLNDNVKE